MTEYDSLTEQPNAFHLSQALIQRIAFEHSVYSVHRKRQSVDLGVPTPRTDWLTVPDQNRSVCSHLPPEAPVTDACDRNAVALHAYVLMTNHVHLLMTPEDAPGISRVMQSVGRRYVQYVNKTYQRCGTLWESRHKASLVDAEAYLLSCYRYFDRTPFDLSTRHRAAAQKGSLSLQLCAHP